MERIFLLQVTTFLAIMVAMAPVYVHGKCSSLPYPTQFLNCCLSLERLHNDLTAEEIQDHCLQMYILNTPDERWEPKNPFETRQGIKFVQNILKKGFTEHYRRKRESESPGRTKRSGKINSCTRKEIRDLTPEELAIFHKVIERAIRTPWDSSYSSQSQYEFFADWHTGDEIAHIHGGAAFLPWHRMYLYAFETMLQSHDSRFCLPYWDPSIDRELNYPEDSSIFSYEYLGYVWPYRYYRLNTRRYFGRNKDLLFSKEDLQNVLNEGDYSKIVFDPARDDNTKCIEQGHNKVHQWVGGDMFYLGRAPRDPIFFLHHCNMDRVWQLYRDSHPNLAYPFGTGPHARKAIMPNFENIDITSVVHDNVTNEFGASKIWDEMIKYAKSPNNCHDGYCGAGRKIRCSNGKCTPLLQWEGVWRKKRAASYFNDLPPPLNFIRNQLKHRSPLIQRNYFLNGKYDVKGWAYLPILVTYMRPADLHYDTYTLKNGKLSKDHDMFDTCSKTRLKHKINVGQQKHFKDCDVNNACMKVFVTSTGKNYNGDDMEYAIVDQRYAVSHSVAYVGIKKPTPCGTEVILSAYDQCGRVCKPMCLVEGSYPPKYKHCTGILRLDNKEPVLYGMSPTEAIMQHWHMPDPSTHTSPTSTQRGFCINFLCDSANGHLWEIVDDSY